MSVLTTCLGHPRIGVARELKKALEAYWSGKSSAAELRNVAAELRRRHWTDMRASGIDLVPSNDFSLYDHVLDTAVLFGAIPERYRAISDPLARYFAMARGYQSEDAGVDVPALEMTKWFDTNYHYVVPELGASQTFSLDATKLLAEVEEARAVGIQTRPVILGPLSFLLLSKLAPGPAGEVNKGVLALLPALVPVYEELFRLLGSRGVAWVQLDEPCLVLDLSDEARAAYRAVLPRLSAVAERPRLFLATYFGPLAENLSLLQGAELDALHVDLVRAPEQLEPVLAALGKETRLSLGVVDGRNVWRTDLDFAHAQVSRAVRSLGADRVLVAPSCSLLHVPVDLDAEQELDRELRSWLAFAAQKLCEVRAIADAAAVELPNTPAFVAARAAVLGRRSSPRTVDPAVRSRVRGLERAALSRKSPFRDRVIEQNARFALPLLPTTTIGSFPQTAEVRAMRAARRAGRVPEPDYDEFLRAETRRAIEKQEQIGLDVLVHGEFERTDMVEYFGEKLAGFAFTGNGWVQSYGSRCVKPPILFGDVSRPAPMTVGWSSFAQAQTAKPMKGMLTGPVTILQWSFVRDDQPRRDTCLQIAFALRDEVTDLEAAGIGMIQVDEPAMREGLPLRREGWAAYLGFAVDAFRLTTSGVRNDTQIHTHMCYAEFGDILAQIAEMDADVISIETSRSNMELLEDFRAFQYPNQVGPGVYDIHSPRVPRTEEMVELLRQASRVLPAERLWVNPDCGLKTRGWPEVEAALCAMVEAARRERARLGATRDR